MGEREQGRRIRKGGQRFEEKGREGGKAAISVIRRPALARH